MLSFLTMRDAVRVRLLSSRWRYFCAATFDLHFDPFTVFGVTWDPLCWDRRKLWEDSLRFVRAVDQVLQFYNREKLESFRVRYSLGNEYASHINRWVIFAVKKHTEKLHLDFSHAPESSELYNFPCHSLQGESSKLKHLTLEACVLRPHTDSIKCFTSLTRLELHDMPLNLSDLDDILFGCTSLEFLKLKLCRLCGGMGTVYIRGQLKLSWLVVEDCSGATTIEISSINLTTFEYSGLLTTFKFVGVPYLKNVFLHRHSWTNKFLTEVAEDFPQIQNLTQTMMVNMRILRPRIPSTYQYVRKLELMVFLVREFDLRSIIFILNAFPCLQKFHLMMQCWNIKKEVKWEYSEELFYHLEGVEISGFVDACNSMELAIYLMKYAPGLKKMVINSRSRRYYGGGRWSQSISRTMSRDERKRIHEVLSKEKVNENLQLVIK
ncbi:hypothetical protein ACHQM5_012141 [Ranunculus cassubicifolius]